MSAGTLVHLLGEQLLPPCVDPVVNPSPDVVYRHGVWSPIAREVTCPSCRQWVHA